MEEGVLHREDNGNKNLIKGLSLCCIPIGVENS
jgi:hypothetical protein